MLDGTCMLQLGVGEQACPNAVLNKNIEAHVGTYRNFGTST